MFTCYRNNNKKWQENKWGVFRKIAGVFFMISAVILATYSYLFTNTAVIDNYSH
jgi:hypothetical protein